MDDAEDRRSPKGVDYRIVYDPTVFVRESIEAVVDTLFEAILLVVDRRAGVPADLARVDHPAGRGAGVARRHVRRDAGARLLAQHAVALRPGAGDRHRRGRCDRGGGERRAAHRAGAVAARGHAQGDGRSHRADHRDRAGAVRGVHADGVHQRDDRAVLPAVRADDRDLDGDLGVQLADAEPGARVAAAQAARCAAATWRSASSTGCSAGSSACSTASSDARRPPTPAACRACCASARSPSCSTSA